MHSMIDRLGQIDIYSIADSHPLADWLKIAELWPGLHQDTRDCLRPIVIDKVRRLFEGEVEDYAEISCEYGGLYDPLGTERVSPCLAILTAIGLSSEEAHEILDPVVGETLDDPGLPGSYTYPYFNAC